MGTDGIYLLDAIWSESAPEWLGKIEAVEIWWTGANTLGTRPSRFSALGEKKN